MITLCDYNVIIKTFLFFKPKPTLSGNYLLKISKSTALVISVSAEVLTLYLGPAGASPLCSLCPQPLRQRLR